MYLWLILVGFTGCYLHGEIIEEFQPGLVTSGNKFFPEVFHLVSSSLQPHPVHQQKSVVPRTEKHQVKSGLAKAPKVFKISGFYTCLSPAVF